jgi:hypothetical protein
MCARQADREFGELAGRTVDHDRAAMLLSDDVPADRQTETSAFAARLGREERLEQSVTIFGRDACAVVADADFNGIAEISRGYLQGRFEGPVVALPLPFAGGVKAITDQVETNAGDVPGEPARSERPQRRSRAPV